MDVLSEEQDRQELLGTGINVSIFLEMVNATNNRIGGGGTVWSVAMREYSGGPQTMFVPTNAAWEEFLSLPLLQNITSAGVIPGSLMDTLVLNHMLDINFVRVGWEWSETSFEIQPNLLSVPTMAGNELLIRIGENETNTTLNDVSAIVEQDILSEFGAVHIINHVLIPPNFNVSELLL